MDISKPGHIKDKKYVHTSIEIFGQTFEATFKRNFLLLLSYHVGGAPAADTIIPLLKMCILSNSHVLLDWMPRAKGIGM